MRSAERRACVFRIEDPHHPSSPSICRCCFLSFWYLRGRHMLARGGRHVRLQHGVPFQADVDVVKSCGMKMVQCGWI